MLESHLLACMTFHVRVSTPRVVAGQVGCGDSCPPRSSCPFLSPPELEQLHLGLYGMSDRLTLAKEGSLLLTQKWCHTLQELDLSGQGFSERDLEQALAAFSGVPGGSHLALCSLNLRGTRVTASTVRSASPPPPVPWSQYGLIPCPAWLASSRALKREPILAQPLLGVGLRDTKGTGLGPLGCRWQSQPRCKGREGSLDWLSHAVPGSSWGQWLNLPWPALLPQRCDQQLPGSAVPQPGVLPLPSPGPEAGLPGRRGSPVVPAAAAHQPGPSQLGSSSQPALPCPLSQF